MRRGGCCRASSGWRVSLVGAGRECEFEKAPGLRGEGQQGVVSQVQVLCRCVGGEFFPRGLLVHESLERTIEGGRGAKS